MRKKYKEAILKNIKITFTFMGIFLLLVNLSIAQTQNSIELTEIRFNRLENKLEVQIELNKSFAYESFTLFSPNRLVIDLLDVERFFSNPDIEINHLGIKTIRTAKFKPNVTRVVFDLAEKIPYYTIKENEIGLTVTFWYEEEKEEVIEKKPPEIKEEPVEKKKIEIEKKEKPAEKIPTRLIEEFKKEEEIKEEVTIAIGYNNGFYFMQDSDFQNVYGKSAFFFGGETIVKIPIKRNEYIGASLGFKYSPDSGKSTFTEEEIKLRMIPITFSVLYMRQFRKFSPYVGLGIGYHNYKEIYPETFAVPSVTGSTWGIHFQAGTYIEIIPSLALKFYFKYHSAREKENGVDVNLGGNEYGVGLAYYFKI